MPDAVLVTSSFLPGRGGIESYLAELAADLSPRLSVLAPARRGGERLPDDLPYATTGHPGTMLVPGPGVARAIVAAAAGAGGKVLFGTPWPLLLTAPRLARRGVRYAVIVHGAELVAPGAVPGLSRLLARCLAGAEAVFAVSRYTEAKVRALIARHRLPPPPLHVLRARIDLDRFRPDAATDDVRARLGVAAGDRVVLSLGRLVPRKGVSRLVAAWPDVVRAAGPATLVVAGTGRQERRLRAMAARSGAQVVLTGRVSEADAPALYALADVFALAVADRWFGLEVEGLGVVLLEAQACGTPCVTGRSGGTPEAVVDQTTGYVVDARDRRALVDAVAGLLADPDLRARMGAAGRAHVGREFSGTSLAPVVEWLDRDVRSKRPTPRPEGVAATDADGAASGKRGGHAASGIGT